SIRWKATRRPSVSQTVTLMLTARLCALARAAWMARFASASLIDMSFAEMDRFQYCVLEFWPCCQCFTITRAGGRNFDWTYARSGSQADIAPRLNFVRFTPESGQTAEVSGCPLCAKSGLMHCNKTTCTVQ